MVEKKPSTPWHSGNHGGPRILCKVLVSKMGNARSVVSTLKTTHALNSMTKIPESRAQVHTGPKSLARASKNDAMREGCLWRPGIMESGNSLPKLLRLEADWVLGTPISIPTWVPTSGHVPRKEADTNAPNAQARGLLRKDGF